MLLVYGTVMNSSIESTEEYNYNVEKNIDII